MDEERDEQGGAGADRGGGEIGGGRAGGPAPSEGPPAPVERGREDPSGDPDVAGGHEEVGGPEGQPGGDRA